MKKSLVLLFSLYYTTAFAQESKEGFVRVNVGTNTQFTKQYHRPLINVAENKMAGEGKQDTGLLKNDTVFRPKPGVLQRPRFEANNVAPRKAKTSTPPSPPPIAVVFPNLGGVDPMIAAGHNFVIVSMDHSFAFFDKNGAPLPTKPGGIAVSWSATNFFQPVIDAANNNTFSSLQSAPDVILQSCNDNGPGQPSSNKKLNEAYDTRVVYEPVNKRFVILSAVRNQVWHSDDLNVLCNIYATRIFAFAISNTEDPRDGFKMWYWTKANYRDWPRISVDKDVLTVAHNGDGADGTPSIYVISLQDMMNGVSDLRYFTYKKSSGNTPDKVIPVARFKSTSTTFDDYVMYLQGDGDNAVLYYFKKSPGMWVSKPDLKETDIDLSNDISLGWHERPVYRNGSIYFTSIVNTDASFINLRPKIYGFDLYRLPLKKDGNDIEFNGGSVKKMEYAVYPQAASFTEYTSYEMPSLSVDERGTILTAYGRLAKTSTGFINPESRYFVFFDGESKHRLSHLLKDGTFMPTFKPDGWAVNVMDGFYHYADSDKYIDYATVTPDPAKRFVFWIAHAWADAKDNKYKIVVGKVGAF